MGKAGWHTWHSLSEKWCNGLPAYWLSFFFTSFLQKVSCWKWISKGSLATHSCFSWTHDYMQSLTRQHEQLHLITNLIWPVNHFKQHPTVSPLTHSSSPLLDEEILLYFVTLSWLRNSIVHQVCRTSSESQGSAIQWCKNLCKASWEATKRCDLLWSHLIAITITSEESS